MAITQVSVSGSTSPGAVQSPAMPLTSHQLRPTRIPKRSSIKGTHPYGTCGGGGGGGGGGGARRNESGLMVQREGASDGAIRMGDKTAPTIINIEILATPELPQASGTMEAMIQVPASDLVVSEREQEGGNGGFVRGDMEVVNESLNIDGMEEGE